MTKTYTSRSFGFYTYQWRFHLWPRAIIDCHFAWAKRYFGLQQAHWLGLVAAYQHTALVYTPLRAVALIACGILNSAR